MSSLKVVSVGFDFLTNISDALLANLFCTQTLVGFHLANIDVIVFEFVY